jgi:hypothetical protein
MGRENRVGNSPEAQSRPKEVYNSSITKLLKHNRGEATLYGSEIVPEVLTATQAAVEMQTGANSNVDLLLTHKRLSRAYAEGAKALHQSDATSPVAASFIQGHVEHTHEAVKLQGKLERTVFPRRDNEATLKVFPETRSLLHR